MLWVVNVGRNWTNMVDGCELSQCAASAECCEATRKVTETRDADAAGGVAERMRVCERSALGIFSSKAAAEVPATRTIR